MNLFLNSIVEMYKMAPTFSVDPAVSSAVNTLCEPSVPTGAAMYTSSWFRKVRTTIKVASEFTLYHTHIQSPSRPPHLADIGMKSNKNKNKNGLCMILVQLSGS